jgi:hypothetical protein
VLETPTDGSEARSSFHHGAILVNHQSRCSTNEEEFVEKKVRYTFHIHDYLRLLVNFGFYKAAFIIACVH